jgi:hypothetical protein
MMEGSGAVPLTNGFGCGSGRSKNIRILRIWIRTAVNFQKMFFFVLLLLVVRTVSLQQFLLSLTITKNGIDRET